MRANEAIREIMKEQEVGVSKLADRMNKKQSTISERLKQDNISLSKLNEMLRVLDYKIVVMPRNISTPKNSYEIE